MFLLFSKVLTVAEMNSFPLPSLLPLLRAPEHITRNDANAAHFTLSQSDKLTLLSRLSWCDAMTTFSWDTEAFAFGKHALKRYGILSTSFHKNIYGLLLLF